jgi:hypothetical protein
MSTNEKAPIKGLKEYKVFGPGTVVYVRHDVQTVKRLKVGVVQINLGSIYYVFGINTYPQERLFLTAEEAFKD